MRNRNSLFRSQLASHNIVGQSPSKSKKTIIRLNKPEYYSNLDNDSTFAGYLRKRDNHTSRELAKAEKKAILKTDFFNHEKNQIIELKHTPHNFTGEKRRRTVAPRDTRTIISNAKA